MLPSANLALLSARVYIFGGFDALFRILVNSFNNAQMDKRWIETVLLIALFVMLGISIAMLGPSLPDLAHNTNTSIRQYTVIFFGRVRVKY